MKGDVKDDVKDDVKETEELDESFLGELIQI